MEDNHHPTSNSRRGLTASITSFISRVCHIPPKPRTPSQTWLKLERISHLTWKQVTGIAVFSLIVAFVLVLAVNVRLLIPDYPIEGTLRNPHTIWTGHINIESDIVVNETSTLVIDGVTIHNPRSYDIIVEDRGNLTIINNTTFTGPRRSGTSEFRVICRDNSVVRVSNSSVGWMWVYNEGGSVEIQAGSYVDKLFSFPTSRKPKILESMIDELHVPVYVSGNFSIVNEGWTGNFDVMIDLNEDSLVEWPRYYLRISDSAHGLIDNPNAKLEEITIKDSRISLNNVNYTHYASTHPSYFDRDSFPSYVDLDAWDSQVSISNCNFGWVGGYSGPTVRLYGSSRAEASRTVLTSIKAYDNSTFEGSRINAHYIEAYDSSTTKTTDSNEEGWTPLKVTQGETQSIIENRWTGIFGYVKAYDDARIVLENVTVGTVHYESLTLTEGESVGYVPP
jgi:hypothetical protein